MKDFLKNELLIGLGAALYGKEKLEDFVKSLVEKGMVSKTEANTLLGEFLKRGEDKSEKWNQQYRERVQSQLKELGFVSREELDALQTQLMLLQQEIIALKNNKPYDEQL